MPAAARFTGATQDLVTGDYIVWATQPQMVYPKGQFPTWGMPAKASLHVVTPTAPPALFGGDAAVQTQTRRPGLVAHFHQRRQPDCRWRQYVHRKR